MRFSVVWFFVSGILLIAHDAVAQSVTLLTPVVPINANEGDDFASTVLDNPWDFNEQRDIGWEQGFVGSTVQASGGVWSAQNKDVGAYVFPLFQGFREGFRTETLPGDTSLPKFGYNYPINAAKYSYLSFRMRDSNRSVVAVYWNSDGNKPGGWPDGTQFGASQDAYYSATQGFLKTDFNFYGYDLTHGSTQFEQTAGSWSGNVISLRIDPSTGAPANSTAEFDWIRLVDPNSAPQVNITWRKSGITNQQNTVVGVYYDTVGSGYHGTPMFFSRSDFDPGQFNIPSAALPPGRYYFYVSFFPAGNPNAPVARSAYSAPLTITSAPKLEFLAPSYESGDDYATVTGNPWDMDGVADIDNLRRDVWPDDWRQFSNESFSNGVFSATANVPLPGKTETDAQVHLRVDPAHPIDTHKYRYMIYRMAIDSTNFADMDDRVRNGWVIRPTWWKDGLFTDGGNGQDAIVYDGWHTYVYDLWDPNSLELMLPYQTNDWIYHFRFDPLETHIPTIFSIDSIELRSDPRPDANNVFQITYDVEDTDSGTFDVQLFRTTDKKGSNAVLIATLPKQAAGTHSYNWDMSGLPLNTSYFVEAVVTDGSNSRAYYSQLPVITGEYTERIPPEQRIDTPLTISKIAITPARLSKKGGNVRVTATIADTSGVQSALFLLSGGNRKLSKQIKMTANAQGIFVGTFKFPAYMAPRKGRKVSETYDLRVRGVAVDTSAAEVRAGRISVPPK